MRRQCRKIAALTLAHGITPEFRWVATDRNMADQPSRGQCRPGPCEPRADADSDAEPTAEDALRAALLMCVGTEAEPAPAEADALLAALCCL